ncbi:MAG: CAP domain-containing protein [Flavobacteriales bacterium]|nr:CAP domain-containing protein [Flavobacteriales bacterium]
MMVFCSFGQSEIIDSTNVDFDILNEYILKEVNNLRKRKRVDTLLEDHSLDKAAKDHADYMAERRILTHSQKSAEKRSPLDRVIYYDGGHNLVGENVQYQNLLQMQKKAKNRLTYQKLAKEIVGSWKKSKGHYANMINNDFKGVSHQYAIVDGVLYCCQVLASEPFTPQYDYKEGPELFVKRKKECLNCRRVQKKMRKDDATLGWYYVSNDSVYYYNTAHYRTYRWYNSKKGKYRLSFRKNNLRKVFNAKGVLAIDVIHHTQFDCDGKSTFHNSLYYDGYYLDYLDKKRIKKEDIHPSKEIVKVFVGMKPSFVDTFYQVDFVYMKRKRPCMQNSTIYVNPDYLQPEEYFEIPNPTLGMNKNLIIEDSVVIRIPFERNQTDQDTTIFQPLIKTLNDLVAANHEVQQIAFTGVASIEGSRKNNQKLFIRRGKIIENYLMRYYNDIPFRKEFYENFDDFRSGLTSVGYTDLIGFSDDSLRIFANENLGDPEVSQILDETRYSTVTILFRDYIPIKEGAYGLSVQRLKDLIEEKEDRELIPLYELIANKAVEGNIGLRDSLMELEIPDRSELAVLHWYDFILRLNFDDSPVMSNELNELKKKKAVPTNGDYLEYRMLFNLFNGGNYLEVDDYDTVLTEVRSKKQVAWLQSLRLILEVESYQIPSNQAVPDLLNYVLKKKFDLKKTYFICQYLIDWGYTAEPYILLSKFARQKGQIPKLYKQYIKLGYFLGQFENKREWKKIKRAIDILGEEDPEAFCDLFRWDQMGVRALEKEEVAKKFCEYCKEETP